MDESARNDAYGCAIERAFVMNKYEKHFGSPYRVRLTFRNACRACATACKSTGEAPQCSSCNLNFIPGFCQVITDRSIEWFKEEDHE